MTDLLFVLLTAAFFALATLLGRWGDRAGQPATRPAGGDLR